MVFFGGSSLSSSGACLPSPSSDNCLSSGSSSRRSFGLPLWADGVLSPSLLSVTPVAPVAFSVDSVTIESSVAGTWSGSSSVKLVASSVEVPLVVPWEGVRGVAGTFSGAEDAEDDRRSDDGSIVGASLDDEESMESECPFALDAGASPIWHLVNTWLTIWVRLPCATIWLTGSWLSKKTLYTVLTAFRRDEWWTSIVGESTSARSAFTICRETGSGVVSVYAEVIVWETRSGSEAEDKGTPPGDSGGELCCCDGADSSKNEWDINLEMQSRLAIISFSFRVSQASFKGSNMSLGLSAPCPALIISKARCVLSRSAGDRLASRDAAMVSRAEETRTAESVFPRDIDMTYRDGTCSWEGQRDWRLLVVAAMSQLPDDTLRKVESKLSPWIFIEKIFHRSYYKYSKQLYSPSVHFR